MAGLSGREMFALNPDMLEDDDDDDDGAFDMATYMPQGWEQGREEDVDSAPHNDMAQLSI